MNIRLRISYDGTAYHGWQRQENAITVQQLIEEAIFKITGSMASVCGCSRTDAGVHAASYYCNYYSEKKIPCEKIPIALNTALPLDVRVEEACFVDDDFHSRFWAKDKTYRYYIRNSHISGAFSGRYSYLVPTPLDVAAMQKATEHFLGKHDFAGFMATGGQQKTTIRTINKLTVNKGDDNMICIEINADAYLYNMVRIIAGTLAYVGQGKISADEIPDIIQSKDRKRAGITAPAKGLFLCEINY
ncbi:MAG: tRNA pseudouridine(38-40) synthase TruA [Eubacteriales bacterium]|nr:tRNA pseudouridine(38-40) synthase TruA [Eubacteriales bacterium]